MPIEPTSVSKPVVREIESASGASLWNSKQGSSSGGKDSPLSSVWDKAIDGAQKLYGHDDAKRAASEEDDDSENTQDQTAPQGNFARTPQAFARPDSFGFLSSSRRSEDAFAPSSELPREAVAPQPQNAAPAARPESAELSEKQSTEASAKRSRDDDETEEKNRRAAASEPLIAFAANRRPEPLATSIAPVAPAAPQIQVEASLAANAPAVPALPVAEVAPVATATVPATAAATAESVPAAPVAAIPQPRPLDLASSRMLPQETLANHPVAPTSVAPSPAAAAPQVAAPLTTSRQAQVPFVVAEPTPTSSAPAAPVQVATPAPATIAAPLPSSSNAAPAPTAAPVFAEAPVAAAPASPVPVVAEAGKPAPDAPLAELAIDPKLAKEAVAEALRRVERPATSPVAPASQTPATPVTAATTAPSTVAEAEKPALPQPDAVAKDPLLGEAPKKELSAEPGKPQSPVAAAAKQPLAEQANSSRVPSFESPVAAAASATLASHAQRDGQIAAATRPAPVAANQPAAPANGNGQGLNALAGAQSVGATGAANPSASGQQGGGEQGQNLKQELASQPASAGSSKFAEKSDAAPSPAFDLHSPVGELSSRRAQAAAKAQPTSYVSKTAEEVKEVVAQLTKSIDRLVSTNPGTMNLRLSFEDGGSMNIRLTLQNGQVQTSMQTDVAGLEAAIKSGWSEFAGEWTQKGVKLAAPSFAASAVRSDVDGRADTASSWDQRPERHAMAQGSDGQSSSGFKRRGASASPTSNARQSVLEDVAATVRPASVVSKTELKTYA